MPLFFAQGWKCASSTRFLLGNLGYFHQNPPNVWILVKMEEFSKIRQNGEILQKSLIFMNFSEIHEI